MAQETRLYNENGKWGLLGTDKQRLTPALYDQIVLGTPYSVVKIYDEPTAKYKVGCINETGQVEIPLAYTDLRIDGLRIIACQKNSNGFVYGVLTLKNEVIIPIQYKSINVLGTLRFAVENHEGKFALYTDNGKALSDFTIEAIHPYEKGYCIFEQNGLMGLLDREGNIKVEARYRSINFQPDGQILVQKPTQWQWISSSLQVLKSIEADTLLLVDTATLLIKNKKGYALLRKNLSFKSDYYQEITPSHQKTLFVVKDKKFGIINAAGKHVLTTTYDSIHISTCFIYTYKEKNWMVHSLTGEIVNSRKYEEFYEYKELVYAKKNGFWGGLNKNGKEILSCIYDTLLENTKEHVAVQFKGKYGLLDWNENWLVAPQAFILCPINAGYYLQYDKDLTYLKDFQNTIHYFTNNPLKKVLNGFVENTKTGEEWHVSFSGVITRILQNSLSPVSESRQDYEGFRAIRRNGKWGFIDKLGRLRIANRYDSVQHFSEGLAPFMLRNKWGFINMEDQIIIQPAYESVTPFRNGLSIAKQKGLYGLLTSTNDLILPCRYESILKIESGFFEIRNKDLHGLVMGNGMLLYEPKYTKQEIVFDYIIVRRNGKYGVLNKAGIDVIPTMYDYIRNEDSKTFLLALKTKVEILNPN